MDKQTSVIIIIILLLSISVNVLMFQSNSELNSMITQYKTQVNYLQNENLKLKTLNNNYVQQLNSLQEENSKLKTINIEYKNKIYTLQDENTMLKNNISSLEKQTSIFNEKIEELKEKNLEYENTITSLKNQVWFLNSSLNTLQTTLNKYENENNYLKKVNNELQNKVNNLSEENNKLYNSLNLYEKMINTYMEYYNYSLRYFDTNEFLKNILTVGQENYLKSRISNIVSKPEDWESSLSEITLYVVLHVHYAADQPVPKPPSYYDLLQGYYTPSHVGDVYLSPRETLELGYGDCDDINTLLMAMTKVYFKDFYGCNCTVYLVVAFPDKGSGHVFVIVPVQGGDIVILDASGLPYWTGIKDSYTRVVPKPVKEAWDEYMEHWENPFTYVYVYSLDFYGKVKKEYEGSTSGMLEWLNQTS